MTFTVDENILWLQVSVKDILRVDVLYRKDKFSNDELSNRLVEELLLVQVPGEVAVAAEICHHVEEPGCLKSIVKFQDVRVVEHLHHFHFRYSVLDLIVGGEELLLHCFHRVGSSGITVFSYFEHPAEGALAN